MTEAIFTLQLKVSQFYPSSFTVETDLMFSYQFKIMG